MNNNNKKHLHTKNKPIETDNRIVVIREEGVGVRTKRVKGT